MKSYSLEEITLSRRTRKRSGIAAIKKYLRRRGYFEFIGDIPLITGIVRTLQEKRLVFSKAEFYYAFKQVSIDDYAHNEKRQIIQSILSQDFDLQDKNTMSG